MRYVAALLLLTVIISGCLTGQDDSCTEPFIDDGDSCCLDANRNGICDIIDNLNPSCNDGLKNQNENEIDCGGSCEPCPTCSDGIRNQGETGIDCGGPCELCEGECFLHTDCGADDYGPYYCENNTLLRNLKSFVCLSPGKPNATCSMVVWEVVIEKCNATKSCFEGASECKSLAEVQAACSDGVRNMWEEGVDCGGICKNCETCYDGIQNQGETDVDCGGPCPSCYRCSDGVRNYGETGIDCGGFCPPCNSCDDGIRNQGETGIDCGGPCAPCTHCNDGVKNSGETGIDCGGSCPPCQTCEDGVMNQDELDMDCGGVCGPCPGDCQNDEDCGIDHYTRTYCKDDSVYRNYVQYECVNPGTRYSYCTRNFTAEQVQFCGVLKTCLFTDFCGRGSCIEARCILDERIEQWNVSTEYPFY